MVLGWNAKFHKLLMIIIDKTSSIDMPKLIWYPASKDKYIEMTLLIICPLKWSEYCKFRNFREGFIFAKLRIREASRK